MPCRVGRVHFNFGFWLGAAALFLVGGCEDRSAPAGLTHVPSDAVPGVTGRTPADRCATPQTGCECEEGDVVDCGHVAAKYDDYVTCSMGQRTCSDGVWSECQTEREEQVETAPAASRYRIASLGAGSACPAGFDPFPNGLLTM